MPNLSPLFRPRARGGFPPVGYLVGAQKCATTFFAEALAAHPEVAVAHPKEPDFCSANRGHGLDWYRGCFPEGTDQMLLDASTSYAIAPSDPVAQTPDNPTWGVPERIIDLAPDARILYIVRDPVARAYSAYWHEVRSGYETATFEHAITARNWYLDGSRYFFQYRQYRRVLESNRILVLTMDEVTRTPRQACLKAWAFLGLEPAEIAVTELGRLNTGHIYTGLGSVLFEHPKVRRLTKPLAQGVKRTLPRAAYAGLRRRLTKDIPPMTDAQRKEVAWRLRDDVHQFYEFTGIDYRDNVDLDAWIYE